MITINLLPKEMQIEERGSPTKLLIQLGSLSVAVISFLAFMVMHFYILESSKQELEQAKQKEIELSRYQKQFDDLKKLIERFKTRDETVETVRVMRVPFSKKLHQFSEVLAQGNFPIWLTSLTILPDKKVAKTTAPGTTTTTTTTTTAAQTGPTLANFEWKAECVCASISLQTATNFYEEVKRDREFFKDFTSITVIPSFNRLEFGKEYQQQFGWVFNMGINMQVQPPAKVSDPGFENADFTNAQAMIIRLKEAKDPFAQYLRDNCSKEFQQQLAQYASETPQPSLVTSLAVEFNQLIKKPLYERQRVGSVQLRPETQELLRQGDNMRRFNRLLLEDIYPNEIRKK